MIWITAKSHFDTICESVKRSYMTLNNELYMLNYFPSPYIKI